MKRRRFLALLAATVGLGIKALHVLVNDDWSTETRPGKPVDERTMADLDTLLKSHYLDSILDQATLTATMPSRGAFLKYEPWT